MTKNNFEDFSEFICLKETQDEEKFFNRERSLLLINMYKLYKPKLGSFEVKSMKKMWEIIAQDISNKYRITVSAPKCENRYKVLERNYKKVIDNNNKTGRAKKCFEFEAEMHEIYANKTNINPVILLSSDTCLTPTSNKENTQQASQENEHAEVQLSISDTSNKPSLQSRKRKRSTNDSYTKRNNILVEMKNDFKNYYTEKLKIEKEKLELSKQKMLDREKRTLLMEHLQGTNAGSLS